MFGAGIAWAVEQQDEHQDERRVPRVFRDRLDLLAISDNFLLRYYRFPRHVIIELSEVLEPELARMTQRSHALPVITQVLVSLRFLASGTFQNVLGDVGGISQASASRVLNRFCTAMVALAPEYIQFPLNDAAAMMDIKAGFYAIRQFPNVLGLIDGSHIEIKAPSVDEPTYVNRHGRHSLNVQGICRADLLLMNIVVRWPGSTHDSFIWRESQIKHRLDNSAITGWLLGDSGYPLERRLLTPVRNPMPGAEERFNASHMSTRAGVERCFGVLKSRFRSIDRSGGCLMYRPERARNIIVTAHVVQNRKEVVKTGGGPPLPDLDPLDEMAAAVIGETALSGIPGGGIELGGADEDDKIESDEPILNAAPSTSNQEPGDWVFVEDLVETVICNTEASTQTVQTGHDSMAALLAQGERQIAVHTRLATALEELVRHFVNQTPQL